MGFVQQIALILAAACWSCQATVTCPSSCYCDEDGEYVSCVGDGLWDLPSDLPNTTVRLELRNYLTNTLTAQEMQGVTEIQELKLQQSRIETIENATFSFNQKLQRLDLSQNLISVLSRAVFHGLQKLRFLDLSSNYIHTMEEAFVDLVNLEQLNLRDNRIPQLSTHTFVGLHKVQYLNLDANSISYVEVGTFQYLTNLAHLIISNNPLTTLSRLDFFGSRLQFIDISHVGLDRVPQSLTKFVRDLRLAKNNLTRISAGDFESYPYLGLLVLDDNCVSEIENDALGRQEYLMRLWLNGNCLTKVPPNLPPSLLALYMEENKLTELLSYSFKGLVHLEQLFLQRNNIRVIEPCVFCDLISLKSLDLQANQIENLTAGVFANLSQLETLDLSQNNLKIIDSRCFDGLNRLKTLQISRVPTAVRLDDSMFDPLQNLQNLEVYDSALIVHKILNSTRMLHGLRKVQELNIMHNRLVKLRSDFPSFLPNLKVIKMSGNHWHCDDDIIWLATWIKQSNVQFYSSYSIRCATPESLQYKPLMMLTENDFILSTTAENFLITVPENSSSTTSKPNETSLVILPFIAPSTMLESSTTATYNTTSPLNFIKTTDISQNSSVTGSKTTETRTEASTVYKSVNDSGTSTTPETSASPTFIKADLYRYNLIHGNSTNSTTVNNSSESSEDLSTSTEKEANELDMLSSATVHNTTVPPPAIETTTPYPPKRATEAPGNSTSTMPISTKYLKTLADEETKDSSPQRTVLSSRLRGWTSEGAVTSSPHLDHTTVIIVSAIVAAGGLLVIAGGLVTMFTFIRCRHRYQPVKHKNLRRSSSISYYPQKDEVSIVTLTEGTVGLRTNSHHGLGNKLYYIMENGGSSTTTDGTKEALPDPQLQELLPQAPMEQPRVY